MKEPELCNIATIGIIHDHGISLSAVAFEDEGKYQCSKIVDLSKKAIDENRITKVWLNDFSPSSDDLSCTHTWSFMKCNGTLFTWTLGDHLLQQDGESLRFALHRRVGIDPVFGVKSNERRSLKASITDQRTILLGSLPSACHRHLLYCGQTKSIGKCALYGVTNFDIGIPSSTGSTLLALSIIAECEMTKHLQKAEVSENFFITSSWPTTIYS